MRIVRSLNQPDYLYRPRQVVRRVARIVTEAISRLLDRGEVAVDAGANIGYMTSPMALRVGPPGLVLAFEPHSDVFAELSHNAEDWARDPGVGRISLHRVALSSRPERGMLRIPREFERNRGIFGLAQRLTGSRLVDPASAAARPAWDAPTYLATLDPGRAQDRLARPGWKSFRRRRR
jgi:FkbM family methyltransferase